MGRSRWSNKYRVAGRWVLDTGYHVERPSEVRAREAKERAAMASVNRIILLGEISCDPILCYTASGKAYCYLSITTSDSWIDQSGERRERSEHHTVLTLSDQAELAASLCKGSIAFIEGKLTTRHELRGCKKHFRQEIQAHSVRSMSVPTEPHYEYPGSEGPSFARRILK